MRMKKILLLIVAMTMMAPTMFAAQPTGTPNVKENTVTANQIAEDESVLPLYLTASTGGWNPTSADKQFTYNAETDSYELIVKNFAKKVDGKIQYMWFYQKDENGNIIPWNAPIVTNVQFTMAQLVCKYEIEKGMSSGLKIYSYAYDLEEADIKLTVKLNTGDDTQSGIIFGSVVLEQLMESMVYPDNIYLWGSNIGGRDTKVWGTLTSTAEEGVYELKNFMMPVSVFDPSAGYGADQAFSFFLSTSNESITKGTRFLGHMDAVTGDTSEIAIKLTSGQTFTTTLQTVTQDGSSLLNYNPGLVDIKFDFNTLKLTIKMLDVSHKSTVIIAGTPNEAYEKYLTLEVAGETYPLELSPQDIWYGGDLSWKITPQPEWCVEVECLTPDANVSIVENKGVYNITSTENDLTFLITVSEPPAVEFTFIMDDEKVDVATINDVVWCIDFVGLASDKDDGLDDEGNIKDEFIFEVNSNPFFLPLNRSDSSIRGTMIMFVPVENYDLDIKCTNWEGTGEVPFTIERPTEAAEAGELDGGSLDSGWIVILSPDAADLKFEVEIVKQKSGIICVDEIEASKVINVFNMQGISVLRNGNPDALNLLSPGLYIVNGKKVLVR